MGFSDLRSVLGAKAAKLCVIFRLLLLSDLSRWSELSFPSCQMSRLCIDKLLASMFFLTRKFHSPCQMCTQRYYVCLPHPTHHLILQQTDLLCHSIVTCRVEVYEGSKCTPFENSMLLQYLGGSINSHLVPLLSQFILWFLCPKLHQMSPSLSFFCLLYFLSTGKFINPCLIRGAMKERMDCILFRYCKIINKQINKSVQNNEQTIILDIFPSGQRIFLPPPSNSCPHFGSTRQLEIIIFSKSDIQPI